ncbi:ribonuclease H [Microbacterium capsulatum]|uniref:Ribonuclease H n=1 Tax=Microbacterium capsulatum TaxID=3041921 RepID=A0ABU0XIX0_9MICO|nr:ribonuclease H [Microbacterium sp. ASV81]MDQ4215080.1 ribonuclease H [Microbacterium sp. ASV81]
MTITAAADGSALGNPGPNGWAWYIDDKRWAAGGSPHGTNNQGELRAVLELLQATTGIDEPLVIECDSRYVIDSVTKWMPGWKRRGWRKSDGGPVLNRDLLEGIDEALRGRDVSFTWVKGHAGHPLNEAADARANAAATAYQKKQEPERGPGFTAAPAPAPAPEPPAPARREAVALPVVASSAVPAPALWAEASDLLDGLDAPAATTGIALTVALSPAEHARLRDRADAQGISLEEALRRLI